MAWVRHVPHECRAFAARASRRNRDRIRPITMPRGSFSAPGSATWTAPIATRDFSWVRNPIVEMVILSTLDDTLAPRGAHVASLFCQHVAPDLPAGRSWNDHRDGVADLMVDTVERFAPGFVEHRRTTGSQPAPRPGAGVRFDGRRHLSWRAVAPTSCSGPGRRSAARTIAER